MYIHAECAVWYEHWYEHKVLFKIVKVLSNWSCLKYNCGTESHYVNSMQYVVLDIVSELIGALVCQEQWMGIVIVRKVTKEIQMKHKPRFHIQNKIYTHLLQKQCICVAYDYMSKCIV